MKELTKFLTYCIILLQACAGGAAPASPAASDTQLVLRGMRLTHEGKTRQVVDDPAQTPHTLTLECPGGLPAGAQVRLVIGGFRTLCGGMKEAAWSLDGVEAKGGGKVKVEKNNLGDFFAQMRGRIPDRLQQFVAAVVQVQEPLPPDAAIVFRLKGRIGKADIAPVFGFLQVEVAAPDKDQFVQVGRTVLLELAPAKPAQIEVRCKSLADDAGYVPVSIFIKDKFGNPTTPPDGKVRLEAVGKLENLPATLDWRLARDGLLQIAGVRLKGDRVARIKVRDEATGSEMLSPVILPGPIHGYRHFFGDLHFHTEFSGDGDRPMPVAYAYGRDFLQLDVLASADHPSGPWWPQILAINEAFYRPGRFVTIPAWEVDGNNGHVNIYLRSPNVDMSWTDRSHDWANVSEFDEPGDVITAPHVTMSPGHPDFDWKRAGKRMRLVEMLQTRGCSEAAEADEKWGINPRPLGKDGSVRAALAGGHRVGFYGGTDNHSGYPTRHAQTRDYAERFPPWRMGSNAKGYASMTGFVAKELTREAIWQAMNERHTYATSGMPIVCHVEINGALMGSEIRVPRNQPLKLTARLHGTAPIERVEIISGGKCVKSWDPKKLDVELEADLPAPTENSAYYYLRLLQSDGHRAWASPVWVDVK